MQRTPVKDNRLKSIGYDIDHMKMEVEFPNTKAPHLEGSVYIYHDVPPEVHAAQMAAHDKGKYFADHIVRDRKNPAYRYDLVSKAAAPDMTDPGLPKVKRESAPIGNADSAPERSNLLQMHPTAVDAAAKASVEAAAVPRAEFLAPGTPLPTTYEALLDHVNTVKARITGLLKQDGVRVQLLVTNPDAYAEMGKVFVALSAEKKVAQAWCDADRKPHNDAYKAGLAREKEIMAGYSVIDTLDKALIAYRDEEKRQRREAELADQRREQERLDAEAAASAAQAKLQAEKEAATMDALGQPEVAQIIRDTPVPIVAQTAAPIVYAREVPKVDGMAERGTWKNEVINSNEIPLFFRDRIRMAINDEVSKVVPAIPLDDVRMARLTIALSTIFLDFYSLDQTKINGFIKPKKEAGINLVPGLRVWFDAKTSTTGR